MSHDDETHEPYAHYLSLPHDSELGFAVLQRRLYDQLKEVWEAQPDVYTRELEWRYINQMCSFDTVHDLGILSGYPEPPKEDHKFPIYFTQFSRHVEGAATRILMEAARRQKTSAHEMVVLEPSARDAIHKLINTIREKLNSIDLPEKKREALFNKLNAFAAEVDRNRTRPEAYYAFFIELSRAIKDTSEPILETANRILDFIERAQKASDTLPPWEERKRLSGPKNSDNPELDDEIPF